MLQWEGDKECNISGGGLTAIHLWGALVETVTSNTLVGGENATVMGDEQCSSRERNIKYSSE